MLGPADFKLRPASHDQEDAHLRKAQDRATEELEGSRVGPVHVFEDDENGSHLSKTCKLIDERVQRAFLAALRIGVQRWTTAVRGDRKQCCKKRNDLFQRGSSAPQQSFQLIELHQWGIVYRETRGMLELANDRMERAIDVIRRALIAQRDMRFIGDELAEGLDNARLAIPASPKSTRTCPSPSTAWCQRSVSRATS